MSNINDLIIAFTRKYNESHRLYLNGTPSVVFMNNILEGVCNSLLIDTGFIGTWHKENSLPYLVIEAIINKEQLLMSDSIFFEGTKFYHTDQQYPTNRCLESFNLNKIIDFSYIDTTTDFIFRIDNFDHFTYIPFGFNNEIYGILGLAHRFSDDQIDALKIMSNYIGNLYFSMINIRISSPELDKRFITYLLTDDILNVIDDGILITSQNFNIIYANEYAIQLFNSAYGHLFKSQYINKNLINIFPQLSLLTPIDQPERERIYKNRKVDIVIKDKKFTMRLEFMVNTIMNNSIFYHIVVIKSKDDSKSEQINNAQKNLIAYLSHELRNPLQTIVLANHLLNRKENMPNDSKFNLDSINKSCIDMKKIINDILDLSKIDAQEFLIDMEVCDIETIITDVITDCEAAAHEKGLTIEYYIYPGVPETLYTDQTRIEQILKNLVSNAIKYSNKGTIVLNTTYDLNRRSVIFDIIDQGIGIRETELCYLFKDYGQTSNSSKLNINSNGLGLCISQKIANLLGGQISVRSEHRKGSIFSLIHPVKLGSSGNNFEKKKLDGNLGGRILLVDDNESTLMLFKMLLDNFNYEYKAKLQVECVVDGKDAIDLCKVNNYDIIFMDINMMCIDGCTASKVIKMNGYKGVIVATTGNILAKSENRDLDDSGRYAYFNDVLIKPFDDTTILAIIRKYLN